MSDKPIFQTFVGDSSGMTIAPDGTVTRWEHSGPDGAMGDENKRIRERVRALEGAIRVHKKDAELHLSRTPRILERDTKLWAALD